MSTRAKRRLAALGCAALLSLSGLAEADLITNGNFSTTSGFGQVGYNTTVTGWSMATTGSGVAPAAGGYTFIFDPTKNGTTTVNGVAVASTAIDQGQYGALSLYTQITASPAGGNYIASDSAFQTDAIQQTVSGLTVGQKYALSFYWGGAQQTNFSGATTDYWTATLGSQSFNTAVLSDASLGFTGWQQATFTYTATATSEVLSFLATGTPSGVPPFALLDGVTLNSVPEPGSLALLGIGLIALAAVWGARRKAL